MRENILVHALTVVTYKILQNGYNTVKKYYNIKKLLTEIKKYGIII